MHHTGNPRCKTHCKTRQPLYLLSFIRNAHKFATLGLLPNARWARCLSAHRAAVHHKLLARGEDRLPASPHHGGAAAPRFKCEPKAACPPHACRQRLRSPQLPSAPLPFTAAEVPGMRERSRRGQRTLTLPRRIAGALEGRLRLKTSIIWNHGFLCRCIV